MAVVFAFRCKWLTNSGELDGFTYAIERPVLMAEVRRRQMATNDHAVEVKVVLIDLELCKVLQTSRAKTYSTTQERHRYDYERQNHKDRGSQKTLSRIPYFNQDANRQQTGKSREIQP